MTCEHKTIKHDGMEQYHCSVCCQPFILTGGGLVESK
jgi:hypothetical protein